MKPGVKLEVIDVATYEIPPSVLLAIAGLIVLAIVAAVWFINRRR